jgi:hypothetical protein
MPRWDWTAAGSPDTTEAAPGTGQAAQSAAPPGPGEPVSFGAHIKPLFRATDRQSMSFAFDLWTYEDVRAHAADVLDRLRSGSMPCDGAWPSDKVEIFQRWADSGMEA